MSAFPPEVPDLSVTDSLLTIDGQFLSKGSCWDPQCDYDEEQLGEWKRNLRGGLTFFGIPENGIRFGLSIGVSGVRTIAPIMALNRFVPHVFGWPKQWTMFGMVAEADLIRKPVPGTIRYMGYGNAGLICIGTPDVPPAPELVIETWWRPLIKGVIIGRSNSGSEASKGGSSWSLTIREDQPL